MGENREDRMDRYITRAEVLLEEAYVEVSDARRAALTHMASVYDDLARTVGAEVC